MNEWSLETFIVFSSLYFIVGILVGMAVYRVMWHVDTAKIRSDLDIMSRYNKTLQTELYELRTAQEQQAGRIIVLEETNRELIRQNREAVHANAEILKMVAGTD